MAHNPRVTDVLTSTQGINQFKSQNVGWGARPDFGTSQTADTPVILFMVIGREG
ncbi:MAG: hypothetical protein ACI9W6_002037 [Motiliproteus sp.]|jgi:hypothetical protein